MQRPSLAELIGALSLATDLAAGLGYETALRVCLIATGIGRAAGLDAADLSDVYYTALLRFIGCTAFAHETAWRNGAGDDLAFLGALASADSSKPHEGLKLAIAAQPKTAGFARRAAAVARLLADAQGPKKFAVAHCDLAVQLAGKLEMRPAVIEALGQMYERWDGKGNPNKLRGDAITRPARLLHLGFELAVHATIGGPSAAIELAKTRSGRSFDPALARTFLAHGPEILAPLAAPSVWEHFLVAEPEPRRRLEQPAVDVAHAFACYVDVKSPFISLGNSIGSGIMRTPATIAGQLPSARLVMLAWLIGGCYSLFGAWSLAEVGAMIPSAGGYYTVARRALATMSALWLVGPTGSRCAARSPLPRSLPANTSAISDIHWVTASQRQPPPLWPWSPSYSGATFAGVAGFKPARVP